MPDLADYLDRLLARHAPAAGGGVPGASGGGRADGARRTLVRPRLPGPFERVEALRGAPAEADEPAPLYPQAPRTSPSGGERVRYEREIRTTERQSVVRAEAPGEAPSDLVEPVARPAAPLLRPAAAAETGPRTAAAEVVRPQRGVRASGEDGSVRRAAASSPAPGRDVVPAAPAPVLRPRAEAVPAARDATRAAAAGRRGQRGAERVVHVQIGRLEVSAAGAERPAAGGRPARPQRGEPSLSLADYLARGERTS
ncbi:hypothetical protein ACGFOU_28605 [Streptomyces sp. NPDC048595]|uniref:hypothetical protein n=1 Tax=Streptomyces sp. NPDC048595 TaxID=3365576 RepID=UPI003723F1BB